MNNQLDQNPVNANEQVQDENTGITPMEEKMNQEAETTPVENQEESSPKKKTRAKAKPKDEKAEEPVETEVKEKKKRKKAEPVEASEPHINAIVEASPAEPETEEVVSENAKIAPLAAIPAELVLAEEEHDTLEDEAEEEEDEEAEANAAIQLLGRKELVEMLEELVKEDDINSTRKKIALVKVTYQKLNKEELQNKLKEDIDTSIEKEETVTLEDELDIRFKEAFKIYHDKRQVFLENQEHLKHKNLEAKKVILEDLKSLIESDESLKKTYDEFKVLQDKWKDIGMVPKNEVNNLWQSYHFLVEKFFDKVKINKELRDLDLRKNLEAKMELCEKTEELLLESSILKSFKKLQRYHQMWKEIGPVPQDKKDEIWERFRASTEKINIRRREHYDKLQQAHENNLAAKTALCEKAEEILQLENSSIKDWQHNTDQITDLLKVWKTIGPAPRKQNDDIWERFRGILDGFFAGKKEYFQKIKDEQLNNYNLKVDLCAQAEALKDSTDWRKTTQELIKLQNDWRAIGPVPRRLSDKVWKRFRGACDEFFNAKNTFFSSIGKTEADNLALKTDLIKKVETFEPSEDRAANLEILKGFQRDWMEVGHVPIKEKERLANEFRTVINQQLDRLKISKSEIQNINYRNRIEGMKETADPERMMSGERATLLTKKKKIEEEIKLWENNIGFFSHSKKSAALREEFERKIADAKQEVVTLGERIKLLDKEMK